MRLGIVSDIHCQAGALSAAIAAMGTIDRLVCLGDAISQSRFCNETVRMLRDADALTIRGNHEDAFFTGRGRSAASVDPGLADWLEQRPRVAELVADGRRVVIVHAAPWTDDHPYVPPSHRDFHRFGAVDADVVLYGHTHQPVVTRLGSTLVVNPGSVGEGRPTASGFVRSCAVVDLSDLSAAIIDLD